jgi:hypothetical protein
MHSQTGIVAGLACLIVGLAADPAAADPGPILPLPAVDVSIDLLPDGSPTTAATEAEPTTRPKTTTEPTNAEPINTITRGNAAVGMNEPSRRSAARRDTRTPAPSPTPALRTTVPALPRVAVGPAGPPEGGPGGWYDLIAILTAAVVALFAMAFVFWRGRPEVVAPSGLDPETMEAARRIARRLDDPWTDH